jgi:HEAT repeat protein
MSRRTFEGVDWRAARKPLVLLPNDSIRFSDLRGCMLAAIDLTGVELIGCRLNGTSFAGARLAHCRIIGCFAASDLPPADFRGANLDGAAIINSHLHAVYDLPHWPGRRWPSELAGAAGGTLSQRSDIRYAAAAQLAALGDQRPALVLACLLADSQWEVRAAALDALGKLYKDGFSNANDDLLLWLFQRLGDDHSIVRMAADRLVRLIQPPEHLLKQSVIRLNSADPSIRLASVRAAIELVRIDERFAAALNHRLVDALLTDEFPAIRAETLHLLGIRDDSRERVWRRALTDPDAGVRVKALEAVRLLSTPPPARHLTALLHDPDGRVRLETLYTLGQTGNYDTQEVAIALADPEPEVQQAAKRLLGLS